MTRRQALRVLIAEVPGFPGYTVTSDGVVWSCRTSRGFRNDARPMTPRLDKKGYGAVVLCAVGGIRRSVRIHRLVAELFLPNPDGKPCVRHLDGNAANNDASNLAWGTYVENENDKIAHGTYDLRRAGRLGPDARGEILARFQAGVSQKRLAADFGVSRPTITRLLNGSTWGAK